MKASSEDAQDSLLPSRCPPSHTNHRGVQDIGMDHSEQGGGAVVGGWAAESLYSAPVNEAIAPLAYKNRVHPQRFILDNDVH